MTTITRKCRNCPGDGRMKHPKIRRDRPGNTVPVTLPLHELSDRTRYRAHRYTLDRDYFAVRTSVEIKQHDLLSVDGEVLKVASVEDIAPGSVEIKTIRFARYKV